MTAVTATAANLDQTVSSKDIVLVDFWAAWCGPCRGFAPGFEQAAEENPDIGFAKVDTEAEPELAARFGIMSIPTLMIWRDQVLIYARPGALPSSELATLIERVRGLDMDDVRRQLTEHESSAENRTPMASPTR